MRMGSHPTRRSAAAAIAGMALLGAQGPARAAATVRIGQSLPLTGPFATVLGPIAEGRRRCLTS